jgi:hypothetical protein
MGAAAMLELLPSLPLVIFAETSGEEMGNSNTTLVCSIFVSRGGLGGRLPQVTCSDSVIMDGRE